MSTPSIRAEPPDSPLARRLLARYYEELAGRLPGGFSVEDTVAAPAEELVAPRGGFLVAWSGGEPVGCGAVRRLDGETAEVKRMWVDPDRRGEGLGRHLLAALEAEATRIGCRVVRLDTSVHLSEALGLYRAAGYADIPPYNENRYAGHWLEKRVG